MVTIFVRCAEGSRAASVAGYVCGLIVLDSHTEPWHYGVYRLVETGLGVIVAWLISYVPKRVPIQEPDDEKQPILIIEKNQKGLRKRSLRIGRSLADDASGTKGRTP